MKRRYLLEDMGGHIVTAPAGVRPARASLEDLDGRDQLRRFPAVLDSPPPQTWKNCAAHRAGAVDIKVA